MRVYLTPLAIILGFALVAGAIYVRGLPSVLSASAPVVAVQPTEEAEIITGEPRRAENRHIYGNEDAPTTIVEFSDLECPFCSRLHPTLKRLVDESGGQINWEYRHLPLSIHPNAEPAARASECISILAGNNAFWSFVDALFATGNFQDSFYIEQAELYGIAASDFEGCLTGTVATERISRDMQTAAALGGTGTPFSVVVHADGRKIPVRGALPYEMWQTALE